MHTVDSGCKLGMIGALGTGLSVWWTLSDIYGRWSNVDGWIDRSRGTHSR